MTSKIEELRQKAIQLCTEHGVTVRAYGQAWWLLGDGINRVVAELAGLSRNDIAPLAIAER